MVVTGLRVVTSAGIIALVTWIAQKSPGLGGLIAAAPLVSLLAVIWLAIGHESNQQIAEFLSGVLKGMIPTAVLIIAVVVCLRRGVPLAVALVAGVALWAVCTVSLQRTSMFRI